MRTATRSRFRSDADAALQEDFGRQTNGGFFKKSKDETGKRVVFATDLNTFEYKPQVKTELRIAGRRKSVEDIP